MKIHEFAKELTKESGKQVTANQIIMLLSKKREGLRMTSEIGEDLMEYARIRITGKAPAKKAPVPAKKAPAQGQKKPAAKKTVKADSKEKAESKTESKADGKAEGKTVVKRRRPSASTRPGVGRLTASTRPDAVIAPSPKPAKEAEAKAEKKEEKVEEVKAAEVKDAVV